jgi:hypothetical protein
MLTTPQAETPVLASPRWPVLGELVFVAWLALTCWGFWVFEARPLLVGPAAASQPERIRALEAWGEDQGAGQGEPVLIHLAGRDAGCNCVRAARGRLDPAAFASARQVSVLEATTASAILIDRVLPASAEWLLFSADGQLLYAGPEHSGDFCGAGGSLLLATLAHPDDPALQLPHPIVDAGCGCSDA